LIPENIDSRKYSDSVGIIDWIHTELDYLDFIYKSLGEKKPNVDELEKRLNSYIKSNLELLRDCWVENTLSYNGMANQTNPQLT